MSKVQYRNGRRRIILRHSYNGHIRLFGKVTAFSLLAAVFIENFKYFTMIPALLVVLALTIMVIGRIKR